MSSSAPHKASIMSSSTADIFGHVKGRPLVLKGMTVQQPFCSAIVAGFKLVENRYRCPICLMCDMVFANIMCTSIRHSGNKCVKCT